MWLYLDFFQPIFFLSLLLNNFYCSIISLIPSFPSIVLLSPSIEFLKILADVFFSSKIFIWLLFMPSIS